MTKSEELLVSVILPNYNHEFFLDKRIQSILDQTYNNFELILLDDSSTDRSKEILELYAAHEKVTYCVYNSENSGSVFKQWIKGVELSKGEYVWIAESDDFADLRFLERTVNKLNASENSSMVFTDTYKVNYYGEITGQVSLSKPLLTSLIDNDSSINSANFSKYLLNQLVIVNASSVLFKKSALLTLDFKILKKLKNVGDVFVYIGIALNGSITFLNEPLNFMRLHDKNTTKTNKRSGLIYKDKILLLDFYIDDIRFGDLSKQNVIDFLFSFLFVSIDFGYYKQIKLLLIKMLKCSYLNQKSYQRILKIIGIYRCCIFKGRPYFFRQLLKSMLYKSLKQ